MSAGDALGDPTSGGNAGENAGLVRTPQQIAAEKRFQQTQAKVDDVVGIMKQNVDSVLRRDGQLSELHGRADDLEQGASQFEQRTGQLKRKFFMQNMKMIIGGVVLVLVVLTIIIVSVK